MSTIRNEIASCSEKAYTSLPVTDAATILYLKNAAEVHAFAQERRWTVTTDGKVLFGKDEGNGLGIPADDIIGMALGYSHELEQIV